MNKFRITMFSIAAAAFMVALSGCHDWNRNDDHRGYDRDGSYNDRNDGRWNRNNYRDRNYSWPDRRDWG